MILEAPIPMQKNMILQRGLAFLFTVSLLSLGACQAPALKYPAWSQIGQGTITLGASTGWAFYSADMNAAGQTGVLTGDTGTDNVGLTPRYGGALKSQYFVTDNLALGGIVELRSFDPDTASPLSAELTANSFETVHWIATSRYFFEPLGKEDRWKPFVGVDYAYINEVDFGSVQVDYPAPFPSEKVNIKAGSYTTIALVGGASYLWNDKTSIDFGGFYEWTDKAGEVTLDFPNLGGATADISVEPEGLILFAGVTFYF